MWERNLRSFTYWASNSRKPPSCSLKMVSILLRARAKVGFQTWVGECVARNYLSPMVQKVNDKHSLDCEAKVLIRKRNATNEEVYSELKTLIQASYGGVAVFASLECRKSWASSRKRRRTWWANSLRSSSTASRTLIWRRWTSRMA